MRSKCIRGNMLKFGFRVNLRTMRNRITVWTWQTEADHGVGSSKKINKRVGIIIGSRCRG